MSQSKHVLCSNYTLIDSIVAKISDFTDFSNGFSEISFSGKSFCHFGEVSQIRGPSKNIEDLEIEKYDTIARRIG